MVPRELCKRASLPCIGALPAGGFVWVLFAGAFVWVLILVGCHRVAPAGGGAAAPLDLAGEERPLFEIHMGDPEFFSRPGPPQDRPITRRIGRLVHPTLGVPALALAGGLVALWFAPESPSERAAIGRTSLRLETRLGGVEVSLPLEIMRVDQGRQGAPVKLLARVPAEAPRATYDLVAVVPGTPIERQPRSLRVLHADPATRPIRLALVADQQLWDPTVVVASGRKNARAYPFRGEKQENRAMARQVLHEVGLWDPDFTLQLGDVVFGLDYEKEYEDAISMLAQAPVAGFFVPGNHDAYAIYAVDLKQGAAGLAVGALRCRHLVPRSREELSSWRVWEIVRCVYGDVRGQLFGRLFYDGLVAWQKNLGPPYYSFRVGSYQFIALNTYDGTPERRHAYSFWVDFAGLHLGAPLVDNYGGYITDTQLRFVEREAQKAAAQGLTVVFVGHHDPRGNAEDQPFHENEPFPTSPVGLGHFEEWNYDGAWNSDPKGGRGPESAERHSGHRLLSLVARYGSAYICGHAHLDEERTYRPGERILGDILAKREVTFLRVTTASSSTSKGSYWGYRMVTAHPDGRLDLSPFSKAPTLGSVPAGNLWEETLAPGHEPTGATPEERAGALAGAPTEGGTGISHGSGTAAPTGGDRAAPWVSPLALHSGLPRGVVVRVSTLLPEAAGQGYRFGAWAPARARLMDVWPLPGARPGKERALYALRLDIPPAASDVVTRPEQVQFTDLRVLPAAGNRPPQPLVRLDGRPLAPQGSLFLRPGQARELDASGSRDPDGDDLLPPLWRTTDARGREMGPGGRGPRLRLTLTQPGPHRVHLVVRDIHGAAATWSIPVVVR